jgi:hypothetical protein
LGHQEFNDLAEDLSDNEKWSSGKAKKDMLAKRPF